MAKVSVKVAGGSLQVKEAACVEDLAKQVNADGYIASVNGEPVAGDHRLSDDEFVSFAKPVKAGHGNNP